MTSSGITVRTHVARDLLQSAALFKSEKLVVWEYVSNGLQYVAQGIKPVVGVTIDSRRKRIEIADNGSGMDKNGLQNFFLMHGENKERKAGRIGRGRFGTGKSAAFGIADRLRVLTVKDGQRNTVELHRDDIEKAGESSIPVRILERNVATDEPNGTVVTITQVKLPRLDQRVVIQYIERHLARWPNKPEVFVNNHECEFVEPAVARAFEISPVGAFADVLGDVTLYLKIAKVPLDSEFQGVAIHANGVWLETTLAGAEGQPMAQYIFGHIDVPLLDDDRLPIPAFDMSRSMQLNRNNDVVQTVLAFVGTEVDRVRRELTKEDKARRAEEEAKKLAREANIIAEMINSDFAEFSDRVARVRAKAGRGRDDASREESGGGEDNVDLTIGGTVPAIETDERGEPGLDEGERRGAGGDPPKLGRKLKYETDGKPRGNPIGGSNTKRRPSGGFHVDFREMGAESPRASYVSEQRTIFINLDHPQILAAKGSDNTDNLVFRRLAYEVAFSEYAIALASELAANNEYLEPSDPIFDIRDTMNRMARRAAVLYEC